jgi:hypothetical protein
MGNPVSSAAIAWQPRRADGTQALLLGKASFAAIFAALAILVSLPVLFCETLPLVDYPNHLARMHILLSLQDSAALQAYYEFNWRALPNLAMDLAVPPLAHWLPLEWAGKAFVIATLFMLAGGVAVLYRVLFARWSAWPLLAFLLLYSRTFLWGFLNYLFGVGGAFFAFALLIALAHRPSLRVASVAVAATMIFFAHLVAFGLLGLMVVGYELGIVLRERPPIHRAVGSLARAGIAFLPGLAIFLLLTPPGGGHIAFSHFVRKLDLLFTIFDNYSTPFDIVCFAIAVAAFALAFWRRWISLHPAIAMPLGLLFLAYLAMPTQLATGSGADHRLPVVIALLLVAGSDWKAPNAGVARAFMAAGLAMFLARTSIVAFEWQQSDRTYSELLPAFDEIPAGSRVAIANPHGADKWAATPLNHFPAYAVLRRDAFMPEMFAFPSQQPIVMRPHYRALADTLTPPRLWAALVDRTVTLDAGEKAAFAEYDFVAFQAPRRFAPPLSSALTPLFTTPRFVIARVNRAPPL